MRKRRLGCRHEDFNRSNVPAPRPCRLCTSVIPAEPWLRLVRMTAGFAANR